MKAHLPLFFIFPLFLKYLIFICVTLASALPLSAQFFINLDFESAVISQENIEQNGGWALDWELAAPGWSHSSADDTGAVYYPHSHVGYQPYFRLIDHDNDDQIQSSLEGRYSLQLKGGDLNTEGYDSNHLNVYITQNGTIPSDSRSIHLLSDGPVTVFFEDNLIPMILSEGYQWSGDISTYAGMTGILKIMEMNTLEDDYATTIDAIRFSTIPVPEPALITLLASFLAFIPIALRRLK